MKFFHDVCEYYPEKIYVGLAMKVEFDCRVQRKGILFKNIKLKQVEGDVLIINNYHRKAGRQVVEILHKEINNADGKYFITVAGESGAGKSEIAASIAAALEKKDLSSYIFAQDDYFVYPPKTNEARRKQDIGWVGMQEVKLSLLDEELEALKKGVTIIEKPLVIFDEDRITTEKVDLSAFKVIIAEGTYTTALRNVDCRVFIDRNLNDTRKARAKRAREKQDDFLEKILTIEHRIISAQKEDADIIISKSYNAIKKEDYE
jgi:uridine kinase